MRIAMVSEHANPLAVLGGADAGGQNVHVAALSRALAEAGDEVIVYTRRDDADADEYVTLCPGVTVVHVPAGPATTVPKDELLPYIPELGRNLSRRFRVDRPDLVHSHFWMSALASLMGVAGKDIPLTHTFHALGVVKRRYQGRKDTSPRERLRLERQLCHDVDHVIATCSDEVAELERLGMATSRVTVVPCGVDVDRFAPDGDVLERSDRPRLVAIGRMVERKGYDTAIAALAYVPGAELVVAGGPPADRIREDAEARRLLAVAEEQGVADRVRLVGSVPQEDVPALLRSADLIVNTPWYEPFGIVPLEAAACGRPLVGSAVGGLLDSVVDGVTGVLVPPRRPDVLGRTIASLLAEPDRLERFGRAARRRAEALYAWPRIAAETARVYQEVLAAQPARNTVAQA